MRCILFVFGVQVCSLNCLIVLQKLQTHLTTLYVGFRAALNFRKVRGALVKSKIAVRPLTNTVYRITGPLRSLSLVDKCVEMRVYKHGCDVLDSPVF